MSANTLTGLIPVLYKAANKVAREQIGFIGAVYKDSDVEKVAKDQTIRYPIVAARTPAAITAAATGPDPSGETVSYGDITVSNEYSVTFPWTGNEQASIRPIYEDVLQQQFEQAMRALCNQIETDLFLAAKRGASRAYGSAGSTPFNTAGDFTEFSNIRRILIDNGAPTSDLQLVLNTTASANLLGKQSSLFKVNEAGAAEFLREATFGKVQQLNMRESGQIVLHTKGTGGSYVFNGSHAIGATSVVAKTGTNTVLYGDVVTFEDDTANKYVVNTGIAAAGTMVIGGPGLRQLQTDGKTITVGNNYTGNWAFDRYAIHLVTRVPMMPDGGDSAEDVVEITDPFSDLTFQVALYRQRRQVSYEVGIAWGTKVVKSDFIACLLG